VWNITLFRNIANFHRTQSISKILVFLQDFKATFYLPAVLVYPYNLFGVAFKIGADSVKIIEPAQVLLQ
jgi:hypothetical protein